MKGLISWSGGVSKAVAKTVLPATRHVSRKGVEVYTYSDPGLRIGESWFRAYRKRADELRTGVMGVWTCQQQRRGILGRDQLAHHGKA